ncbi:MAG: ParB N-terminal domain-containing protein [Thermodesulfobacteriota bacterium]
MQIAHIQLKHINFSDYSFSLLPESYPSEVSEKLKTSISHLGILHPPIVKADEQNFSYQIITGRKRLNTAYSLDFNCCCCLKLPFDLPYLETLNIVWEEALYSHSLSSLNQAVFFEKISKICSIKEIARLFLPLIDLPPSTDYINKKLQILRLDQPLQIALHKGRLNEQVSLELGRLPFSDRMALFEVIELLKLSAGNQKKLTRSCCELAARNRTTVLSILSQPKLAGIINSSNSNIPQKAGHFMKVLHEERYPRLTEAENDFRRFEAGLSLPANIRINHDPSFEKDELNLTITCPGRKELENILNKIRN